MSGRDGIRRTLAAFGVMCVMAVPGPAGAEPGAEPAGVVPGVVPVGVPLPPPAPAPVPAEGAFADCP